MEVWRRFEHLSQRAEKPAGVECDAGTLAGCFCSRGAPAGSWREGMLARKPRMLVTVALANKMARTVWALLVKQEDYRAPVPAAA